MERTELKRRLDPGQKKAITEVRSGHSKPSPVISDNANKNTALTAFGPVPSCLALQVAAHRSHLRQRAIVESFQKSQKREAIHQQSQLDATASSIFKDAAQKQKQKQAEERALIRAREQFEDKLEQDRDEFSLSELSIRSAIELRERRTRKQLREASWRGRQTIIFNASVTAISSAEQKLRARIRIDHFMERELLERNCVQRVILNDRVQFLAHERIQRAAIMHLIAAQLAWRIRQEEELTRMISLERRSRQKVEDEEHFDFGPLESAKKALLEERAKQLKRDEEVRQAKLLELEQHNRMCRVDLERAETNTRQALRSEDLDARVQIRALFVVAKRDVQKIEDEKRRLALEQWLLTCARQQQPIIQRETQIRQEILSATIEEFNDVVGEFHQQWAELLVPVTANFGATEISCCRSGPPVAFASHISFAKKPYLWYRDMYLVAVTIRVRFLSNGRGANDLLSLAAAQVASVIPKKRGAQASMATTTPGLRLLIDGTVLSEDGVPLCTAKFGDDSDGGGGGGGGGEGSTASASSTLDFEFVAPTDDGIVPLDHVERILKNMTLAPDVQLLSYLPRQLDFTATMTFQRRVTPGSAPLKGHQLLPGSKESYSTGCVYSISVIPPLIGCYGKAHSPQVSCLFDVSKRLKGGRSFSALLLPDPQGLRFLNLAALAAVDEAANSHHPGSSSSPSSASAAAAAAAPKKAALVTRKSHHQQHGAMLTSCQVKIRFVTGFVLGEDAIRVVAGAQNDGFKVGKDAIQLDGVTIAKSSRAPGYVMCYDFGLKNQEPFPLSHVARFLSFAAYHNDNDNGPASSSARTLEISIAVKRVRDKDEPSNRNLDLVSFINAEIVFTSNWKEDCMMHLDPGKTGSALPALIKVSREHASSAMRRYLNKVEEKSAPLFPSVNLELKGPNPTSVVIRASISGGATFTLDIPKPGSGSRRGGGGGGGGGGFGSSKGTGGAGEFDFGDGDGEANNMSNNHGNDFQADFGGDDDFDALSDEVVASVHSKGGGVGASSRTVKKKEKLLGTLALGAVPDDMKAPEDATGIFWCGVENDPNIPATRTCVGHICVDFASGKLEAFFKQDTKAPVITQVLRCLAVSVTETTFVTGASRANTTAIAAVQITVTEHAPAKRAAFSTFTAREPEVALLQRLVLYVAPSITTTQSVISFPKETDVPQLLSGIVVLPSAANASTACGSKLASSTLQISIVDGRSGFEQLTLKPHDEAERDTMPNAEFVTLAPANGEILIKVGFKTVARVVQMEIAGKPLILELNEADATSDIAVPLLQHVLSRLAYLHSDADVLYEKVLLISLTDVSGGACYAATAVQVVPSFEPTVMDDPPTRPIVYRVARFPFYKDSWMPLFVGADLSDPDTELVGDAFINVDPVSGTTEDDEIGFSEVPDPQGRHVISFDRLSKNSPLSILCNGREVGICRNIPNEGRGNGLRVTFRPGIHLEVCGAVMRSMCFRRLDEEVLRTIGDSTELKSYVFRFNAGDEEGVPDTRVPFEVRLRPPLLWRLLLHDAPLITAPRTVQPFRHVQTGAPASEAIANDVLEVKLTDGGIAGDAIEVGGSNGIHCVKDPQTQQDVVVVDLDVTRRLMTRVIGVTPGFSGIRVANVSWEAPYHMKVEFNAKCPLPANLVSLVLSSVGFKIAECTEERKCKLRSCFTHHVKVDDDVTSQESGWLDSAVVIQPNDEATEIHLKHNIVPCFASGSCFPFEGLQLTDADTEFFDDEGIVSVVSGTSGVALTVLAQGGTFILDERPVDVPGLNAAQMKGISQFQVLLAQGKKPAATLRVHEMSKGASRNAVYFDNYEHLPLPLVGKLMECIAAKIAAEVRPAGHLLDVHLAANPRTTATTARVQLDVALPCCTRVDPAPILWMVANDATMIFPELINITIQSTASLEVEFRFLDADTFWTSPLLRDAQFTVSPPPPFAYASGVVTVTTPGVSTPTIVCVVDTNAAKYMMRLSFPRSSSREGATRIESVLRAVGIQVPEGGTVVPAGAEKAAAENAVPGQPIELAELRVVVSMTVPTASGPPASLALVKNIKRVVQPKS